MRVAAHLSQGEFEVRCEWGLHGVKSLAPISDVVVIVDVLSFTTCVDIATANGAVVFPYRFRDDSAGDYARARNALLAGPRGAADGTYSLSPAGLLEVPAGVRLVLPSPNGSTLSLATGAAPTLAGCLRNSRAVAARAARIGRRVAVIPCGSAGRTTACGLQSRTSSAQAPSSAISPEADHRRRTPRRHCSSRAVPISPASSRSAPQAGS